MKKIIIVAVLVCTALVSQAASIDWSVGTGSWTLSDGSKPAKGTLVYLINGATALDTISAAVAGGSSSITSADWFYGAAATDNTKGLVEELRATSNSLTDGKEYAFSVLMVDGDKYMVSSVAMQNAYNHTGEDSNPLSVSFTKSMLNGGSQTAALSGSVNGWATAVPEPTSGLLLLIGMAALALRRKHK